MDTEPSDPLRTAATVVAFFAVMAIWILGSVAVYRFVDTRWASATRRLGTRLLVGGAIFLGLFLLTPFLSMVLLRLLEVVD
jgi:hypothetical protein